MSELHDKILAADDLVREKVEIPEWGVTLWIRTMPGWERDDFEISVTQTNGMPMNLRNIRARLVARTAVNESGERIFTDAETATLGEKSGMVLDRLWAIARRLNGLSAADVQELAGNSSGTLGDDLNID